MKKSHTHALYAINHLHAKAPWPDTVKAKNILKILLRSRLHFKLREGQNKHSPLRHHLLLNLFAIQQTLTLKQGQTTKPRRNNYET